MLNAFYESSAPIFDSHFQIFCHSRVAKANLSDRLILLQVCETVVVKVYGILAINFDVSVEPRIRVKMKVTSGYYLCFKLDYFFFFNCNVLYQSRVALRFVAADKFDANGVDSELLRMGEGRDLVPSRPSLASIWCNAPAFCGRQVFLLQNRIRAVKTVKTPREVCIQALPL